MHPIRLVLCSALVIVSCARERENFGEEEFVTNEIRELKAALAARDETKVLVGCMMVEKTASRMPAAKAAEIERMCYVDAPRLWLENAVRAATDAKAETSELADLNCFQLMVGDAFKTLAKHPTKDPALLKLVDDYTRLCPDQVAKHRSP